MEIKRLTIYCATQKEHPEDTPLYRSIEELKNEQDFECDLRFFTSNTRSLAEVYNKAFIDACDTDGLDAVIMMHDDVILNENPIPKLEKLFDQFDVVGVAGASTVKIESPALWHIMGGGFFKGNLHGSVNHAIENPETGGLVGGETNFGPYPHRVVMIDGVFMAFKMKYIEKGPWFDELCPSKYHFYDLNLSTSAHLAGFKVGVGDISITHLSPGLREFTDEWREGENYFLFKYGK